MEYGMKGHLHECYQYLKFVAVVATTRPLVRRVFNRYPSFFLILYGGCRVSNSWWFFLSLSRLRYILKARLSCIMTGRSSERNVRLLLSHFRRISILDQTFSYSAHFRFFSFITSLPLSLCLSLLFSFAYCFAILYCSLVYMLRFAFRTHEMYVYIETTYKKKYTWLQIRHTNVISLYKGSKKKYTTFRNIINCV